MNSNGPMSMALVAVALITVRSVGRNVFTCFCVVCLAIVVFGVVHTCRSLWHIKSSGIVVL